MWYHLLEKAFGNGITVGNVLKPVSMLPGETELCNIVVFGFVQGLGLLTFENVRWFDITNKLSGERLTMYFFGSKYIVSNKWFCNTWLITGVTWRLT